MVLGEFYEDREPYDAILREAGAAGAVTMSGDYVPSEAVGDYFSASDLVVLPYRSATQSGIVQVAYQLERPVLVTRVGGLEEMVRDGESGMIVAPDDLSALAGAVGRFYDSALETGLVEGVRRMKAGMGWDSMAAAIERLARG